ncbi:hypothetical protein ACJ73_01848 [Blastomyces percursus]|uniref:NmrA-like domain-containing protein n=1 Tax=Blastomyces percursus TaxID=1658174 RepID=A0A1J9RDU9_9EURO|nr:hypothetical protein ACJ73_01848 [Blastomyces percursus]
MTIFLGGRGKTTRRLASIFSTAATEVPFLIASRTSCPSSPYRHVPFDWFDESTWAQPFNASEPNSHPAPVPSREYTLSARPFFGHGPADDAITENFSEGQHLLSIKEESLIYSAKGEGRIPFVSAEGIARVAFRSLTDARLHNTEHLILGPELLSHDDLEDILSSVLGRTITHVNLSEAGFSARMESTLGIPQEYAQMLAVLETNAKNGAEDRMNNDAEKMTGKGFRDFAEASSGCWVKDS